MWKTKIALFFLTKPEFPCRTRTCDFSFFFKLWHYQILFFSCEPGTATVGGTGREYFTGAAVPGLTLQVLRLFCFVLACGRILGIFGFFENLSLSFFPLT